MTENWARLSAAVVVCVAISMGALAPASSAAWTKELWTTEGALLEVSCWANEECLAVGEGSATAPFAEWDSVGTWTAATGMPPPVTGATGVVLNGVSCTSKAFCVVTGVYLNSLGVPTAFAEKEVSGTWTVLTSSGPTGSAASELDRVSCASAEVCMMVGVYESGTKLLPYAEKWTVAPSLTIEFPPGLAEGVLIGVSCVSTEECMAVGWTETSAALADRWSGGSWAQTTSASSTYSPRKLGGVDCLTGSVVECTAVGFGTSAGVVKTTAEDWTKAGGWVSASSKNPSATVNKMLAVGCLTASKCFGVGEQEESPKALIQKLEGGVSTEEAPAAMMEVNRLLGVSCKAGGMKCIAVGYYISSGKEKTLAELGP